MLAFDDPPSMVPLSTGGRLPAYDWTFYPVRYERPSINVVKELLRKSLDVACARAGLAWCENRGVFYFTHEGKPQRSVSFV
ncbi:MAG TPA: hypothetical protein VG099_10400, partial [Gemmataceae bacterium]|nr:hypothetical protein [Gemmataceae bacterium]